jgi:hypothetical protein
MTADCKYLKAGSKTMNDDAAEPIPNVLIPVRF